jgi:beta-glucosidase
MTLAEKAAQMMCVWQERPALIIDPSGKFDLQKARAHFKRETVLVR